MWLWINVKSYCEIFYFLLKLKPLNVNAFPCWIYQLSSQFWRWHLQEIYVPVGKIAFWVICRYFPFFHSFYQRQQWNEPLELRHCRKPDTPIFFFRYQEFTIRLMNLSFLLNQLESTLTCYSHHYLNVCVQLQLPER